MNTTLIQSRPLAGSATSSPGAGGSVGGAEAKRELVLRWSLDAGRLTSRWHSVPAAGTGVGTSGGPGGR